MIRLPGTEQSPAWLQDVQGCEGHWLRVPHQGQTLHTKNQDVPVFKINKREKFDLAKMTVFEKLSTV